MVGIKVRLVAVLLFIHSFVIAIEVVNAGVVVRDTITISPVQSFTPDPSIDGDLVVWSDGRNGSRDVYGYNLATGQEFSIATGGREKYYPQVDGQYVLWNERSSGTSRHIYAKDLTTGTVHTVVFGATYVDEYYNVVNGKVYFSAELRGSPTGQFVYSYDLLTGQTDLVSNTTYTAHRYPRGSDGLVAWQDGAGISVFDTVTGQTDSYTTDGQAMYEPDIGGNNLVSVVNRVNRGTIEVVDLVGGGVRVIDNVGKYIHPSIDGNLLAYIDYDSLPGTLRAVDLADDAIPITLISNSIVLQDQQNMEVSGNRIVWTEVLSPWDQFQVNVTTLVPEPASLFLLAMTGMVMMRRQ